MGKDFYISRTILVKNRTMLKFRTSDKSSVYIDATTYGEGMLRI